MFRVTLPRCSWFPLAIILGLTTMPHADAAVVLPDQGTVEKVDFERHIMGLFGRLGCSAGSCHGSFQGKGGLQLSLFGYDPAGGGGIFQISHMSEDSAEFIFFGWDKDIRRNTKQYIDVRKGDNPDIRVAVVRKMVSIIRDHERGDFFWESYRLGRFVPLSARPKDNAELEGFLMREFFPDIRPLS